MIITPVQASDILGVTERRVRQMVQSGELKSEGKFGATIAVNRASVLKLKLRRTFKAALKNGKPKKKV